MKALGFVSRRFLSPDSKAKAVQAILDGEVCGFNVSDRDGEILLHLIITPSPGIGYPVFAVPMNAAVAKALGEDLQSTAEEKG